MFQSHVDSLIKTVNKLIQRKKTPENVMIKYEHATYLGCPFWSNQVPVNEVRPSGVYVPMGRTSCLVSVKLIDLYQALKGAKGVEYKELKTGRAEAETTGGGGGEVKAEDATVNG